MLFMPVGHKKQPVGLRELEGEFLHSVEFFRQVLFAYVPARFSLRSLL